MDKSRVIGKSNPCSYFHCQGRVSRWFLQKRCNLVEIDQPPFVFFIAVKFEIKRNKKKSTYGQGCKDLNFGKENFASKLWYPSCCNFYL